MRDLGDNVTSINLIPAFTKNLAGEADQTTAQILGSSVDTKGEAKKLYALLSVGTLGATVNGNGTVMVTIQESADNITFSTLSAFTSKGGTALVALDLTPTMRYIRASASLSVGSVASTLNFSVVGIFYDERYRPSNVA